MRRYYVVAGDAPLVALARTSLLAATSSAVADAWSPMELHLRVEAVAVGASLSCSSRHASMTLVLSFGLESAVVARQRGAEQAVAF